MRIQKHKFDVQIYHPKERLLPKKEETLPVLNSIGARLGLMGGSIGLFISGIFAGILGVFRVKKEIRSYQMKREKVLDLRKRR